MTEEELQSANILAMGSLCAQKIRARRSRETPREACKRLLHDLGVETYRIHANRDYWSHAQQDCSRWEFAGRLYGSQCEVNGYCYDSMTDVRKANRLQWVSDDQNFGEVSI